VHRQHEARAQRLQHLDHSVGVERIAAVDRHQHHVDAAKLSEMLGRERVMQVTQVGDAEIGCFEHKDGVAVALGAAAPVADVRDHVADANVVDLHIVRGRAAVRVPAAQDVADCRVGTIAEMGRVSLVHGRHVGDDERTDVIIVVRRCAHPRRALDDEGGMPHEGDAHLVLGQGGRDDGGCAAGDESRAGLGRGEGKGGSCGKKHGGNPAGCKDDRFHSALARTAPRH
jgi:hypothetical protein